MLNLEPIHAMLEQCGVQYGVEGIQTDLRSTIPTYNLPTFTFTLQINESL
jgi:hypothetical protein